MSVYHHQPHAAQSTSSKKYGCNHERRLPEFSGLAELGIWRDMVQPYVYWCLDTPLAYFIGLYTNVPEGGLIDTEQRNWFWQGH